MIGNVFPSKDSVWENPIIGTKKRIKRSVLQFIIKIFFKIQLISKKINYNWNMFKTSLLILFTFISLQIKSQTLKVSESSFLYLEKGSKLTISDLSIAPSSPLVIGPNMISVSMILSK